MAVVSGVTITDEQYDELADYSTEEMTLRISYWPNGEITVDNGDTVIISLETAGPHQGYGQ